MPLIPDSFEAAKRNMELAKKRMKAAAILTGHVPEGSYTSSVDNFPEVTIGEIEQKNIDYEGPMRNPVIVVHGFLGANLKNSATGKNVWGTFKAQEIVSNSKERMRSLALPMKVGASISELGNDTVPDGMLESVKVTFYKYTYVQKAYRNLLDVLHKGGYRLEDAPNTTGKTFPTLFGFAYDWRRDIPWNAAKLHEFILEKQQYLQDIYKLQYGEKEYDIKFDLICHSMGGLLGRYYLRYGSAELPPEGKTPEITWSGALYINKLFLLGTPNAGYVDTIKELTEGIEIPKAQPALIGTWPTYYQMMPIPESESVLNASDGKPVDIYDVDTWKRFGWGLANPKEIKTLQVLLPDARDDSERVAVAHEHLEKCLKRAKAFVNAMSIPADPPDGVSIFLFLGNAVKTSEKLKYHEQEGKFSVITCAPGDGKVTKSSALFDKRITGKWTPYFKSPISWNNVILLRAAHMGITVDPAFKDNVLFALTTPN